MFQQMPPAQKILEVNIRLYAIMTVYGNKIFQIIGENLECIIRTVEEELSNWSCAHCKRRSKRNSGSRKPDKHKICYYGHHLGCISY